MQCRDPTHRDSTFTDSSIWTVNSEQVGSPELHQYLISSCCSSSACSAQSWCAAGKPTAHSAGRRATGSTRHTHFRLCKLSPAGARAANCSAAPAGLPALAGSALQLLFPSCHRPHTCHAASGRRQRLTALPAAGPQGAGERQFRLQADHTRGPVQRARAGKLRLQADLSAVHAQLGQAGSAEGPRRMPGSTAQPAVQAAQRRAGRAPSGHRAGC